MSDEHYGFSKKLELSFDDAEKAVVAALKEEGFGILTEIDVKATLKKKLDVDFKPYKILGACNPAFAYEALQVETEIGLLLPCNVILYQDDDGKTVVSAIDPRQAMGMVKNPELGKVAITVTEKLKKVIASV